MADLIVRDRKDYPDADAARASLPPAFADHPFAGVWLQPGDDPELHLMYVFTTRPAASLAAAGWQTEEAVGRAHGGAGSGVRDVGGVEDRPVPPARPVRKGD